jgi:ParB-like chromosome segregation protein Spo0J
MTVVRSAFRPEVVRIGVQDLVLSKEISARGRKHPKYRQIAASLASVGMIEPLVVFPADGKYRVLDGNKRLDIYMQRKAEHVDCIVATADEAYNYNRRVNYLSTIGEHQMILRALRHNTAETIAQALDVNVATIQRKRNLLDGICSEAIELLKARRVSPKAFPVLRKMKPVRQLAAAQMMVASNKYSEKLALALLAGTSDEMLLNPQRSTRSKTLTNDQRARLVAETDSLLQNTKAVETSYGEDALTLSVCCRYLQRLLNNKTVSSYLQAKHGSVLAELQSVVASFHDELGEAITPLG